jgi:aspartate-semialdehyde dehydrogenase
MNIAVVGSTGLVGLEMIKCIENLKININLLKLFASKKSCGKIVNFMNKKYVIEEVHENSFENIDYALFAIDSDMSKIYFTFAKKYGCIVIDNSSAFRLNPNYPLVIPEINPEKISTHALISNPNCSTILMNLVLWNIYKEYGISRIVVSTYQAASGAGINGINELKKQNLEQITNNKVVTKDVFGRQYIDNVFSHNSAVNIENGYNEEELKMIYETKKILNDDDIKISVTCIRVPVGRAHSESINITLKNKADENAIRSLLYSTPGVKILDDRINNKFPEPILASGKNEVLVGRIRKDLGQEEGYGYELFIAGDQILKGAALNAVQILKYIEDNN